MTPTEILRKERGELMRKWRNEMKLRAMDVSSFLGILVSNYYRMEQGKVENRDAYLKMKDIHESNNE